MFSITFSTDDPQLAATILEAANAHDAGSTTPAPAAKKAAAPAAKKAAAAPAPDPEQEPEEDLLGTDAPTLEDAVKRATELVAEGKAAEVKAALATAGAKRVSELSGAKIQTFLDAL